jgi:hypothetical protein
MQFNSRSREELARESLTPPGEYDFEIISAEETTSKKGNEMIKLKLRVFVENGEIHVYDYLVAGMEYKLANFCDAIGRSDDYDDGEINADNLVGCAGKLKLVIEEAQKDKDTGEVKWPAKNAVKTYIAGKKGQEKMAERRVKTAPTAAVKTDDEEIPF